MTTGKTIALTIWIFVGKVMFLLFNKCRKLQCRNVGILSNQEERMSGYRVEQLAISGVEKHFLGSMETQIEPALLT